MKNKIVNCILVGNNIKLLMIASNEIVHGLWIGNQLSNLELLTINSFVKNGHEFHLWLYDVIEYDSPKNLIIQDANEIIN